MSKEQKTPSEEIQLLKKLAEIQRAASYIKKGRKQGVSYTYAEASAVINAVRAKMDELNVRLEPRDSNFVISQDHQTKAGVAWYQCVATINWWWIDCDTGAERGPFPWVGHGLDSGDKSPGKAATYCEKFFLLKDLHIPTDDLDPDAFVEREIARSGGVTRAPSGQENGPVDGGTNGSRHSDPRPPARPGGQDSSNFERCTAAQLHRLDDLLAFAMTVRNAQAITAALKNALDVQAPAGKLSKNHAGSLIGRVKAALAPHGYAEDQAPARSPQSDDELEQIIDAAERDGI